MAWYYQLNGSSQGPVEAGQLDDLLRQNMIGDDTLVWTDGMEQWQPYRDSRGATAGTGAGSTARCVECGKQLPVAEMLHYEGSWVCPACKPLFFQRIQEGVTRPGTLVFASVGRRFVAVFVDGIITLIASAILLLPYYINLFSQIRQMHQNPGVYHPPAMSLGFQIYSNLVSIGVPALYEIFLISAYGATLGKMLMKVKVVTAEGGRVSYARATGRHFAKLLSALILMIGYLMAFWDEEKRALHDRMCRTRVVASDAS